MMIGGVPIVVYMSGAVLPCRRVEKTRGGNGLGDDASREKQVRALMKGPRAPDELSRNGTDLRADPAPTPYPCGFVAQIVGQILESTPADPRHAVRAYRHSAHSASCVRLMHTA
jgi:hypothetical protein